MPARKSGDKMIRQWRCGATLLCLLAVSAASTSAQNRAPVIVYTQQVEAAQWRALERQFRVRIVPGRYWYDRVSGAWGIEGGPTIGLILPGLNIGGTLRADASRGGMLVWVNGRRLPWQDL